PASLRLHRSIQESKRRSCAREPRARFRAPSGHPARRVAVVLARRRPRIDRGRAGPESVGAGQDQRDDELDVVAAEAREDHLAGRREKTLSHALALEIGAIERGGLHRAGAADGHREADLAPAERGVATKLLLHAALERRLSITD